MLQDLPNIAFLSVAFLTLFALSELLYHKAKVRVEFTRKLVHFGTGLLTMQFPIMLTSHWSVLLLCGSFLVLLIGTLRFNLLKSVNAVERKTYGSLMFPIAVYCCFLAFQWRDGYLTYFYLPIFILAVSDPLAAICGKKWPIGSFKIGSANKTMLGTAVFFISAFLIATIGLYLYDPFSFNMHLIVTALTIALFSTIAEAISGNGYDNFTIPAAVLAAMILVTG
jgi:phytol kinase